MLDKGSQEVILLGISDEGPLAQGGQGQAAPPGPPERAGFSEAEVGWDGEAAPTNRSVTSSSSIAGTAKRWYERDVHFGKLSHSKSAPGLEAVGGEAEHSVLQTAQVH